MARIALDETHTPELRGKMYAHLAQYAYPKRRAVEMSGGEGSREIIVRWLGDEPTPEGEPQP